MEYLFEFLKIVAPSVVVFLTAFFLIKMYLEKTAERQMKEIKAEANKTILPLRLQAYERVVLYLERIAPNNLVMRVYKAGMSARLMQADMVKAIREEYEHNMTQQVYVSPNTWILLKNAKEETVRLINVAASHVHPEASGIELSQAIFEATAKMDKLPTDVAINYAKTEVQKLFS
ncbi:MAG: hypothetical protein ACOZCO_17720 [Bacteroidota bacterium]